VIGCVAHVETMSLPGTPIAGAVVHHAKMATLAEEEAVLLMYPLPLPEWLPRHSLQAVAVVEEAEA